MFARALTVDLKPGQSAGFTTAIDQQVMPLLSKCVGFRDEIVFVSTDGKQGLGISLWDRPEDAETYRHDSYTAVLEALAPFIAGTPTVATYDVTISTAHHILARMVRA